MVWEWNGDWNLKEASLLKLNSMLQDFGLDLIVRNLKDIGPSLWFAIYHVVCPQDIKMPHHLTDKPYKEQIEHTKLLIGHLIQQYGDAAAKHGLHKIQIKKLVDGDLSSIRCMIDFYDAITTKQKMKSRGHRSIPARKLADLDIMQHQSDSDDYDASHFIDGRGSSHGNVINEIHFCGEGPRQRCSTWTTSGTPTKTARKVGVADRLGRLFSFNFKKQKTRKGFSEAASEQDDSDFDVTEAEQGGSDFGPKKDGGQSSKLGPRQTSSVQTSVTHALQQTASVNSHSRSAIATRSIGCQMEHASSNVTAPSHPIVEERLAGQECNGTCRSHTKEASQATQQADAEPTIAQCLSCQRHATVSLIPGSVTSPNIQSPTKGIIREDFYTQGVAPPQADDPSKVQSPAAGTSSSKHNHVISSASIKSAGFPSTAFIDPGAMYQSTPRKLLFRVDNPDSRAASGSRHQAPETNVEAQHWTFSPANHPERPMFRFSDTEEDVVDSLNQFPSIVSHDIRMLVSRQCLLLFDDYARAIGSLDEADLTDEKHYEILIHVAERHRQIVWQEPSARFQTWRKELYKRADYLNALFEYHDVQTPTDKLKILYKYILDVHAEYVDWKANNEANVLELREWNPGPEPQGPRHQQASTLLSPPRSQHSSRQVSVPSSHLLSPPRSQHSSRQVPSLDPRVNGFHSPRQVPSSSSNPLGSVSFRSPRNRSSFEQAKSPKQRRRTISAPPWDGRERPRGRDMSRSNKISRIGEDDESSRDPALQSTPSLEHGTLRSNSSTSKATTFQSESQERRMARAIHQITQAALSNASTDDPRQAQRRKYDHARTEELDERLYSQHYSPRSRQSSYAALQGERRYVLSD